MVMGKFVIRSFAISGILIELASNRQRVASIRSPTGHENQVSRKIDVTRVSDGTTKTFWHLLPFNVSRHIDNFGC